MKASLKGKRLLILGGNNSIDQIVRFSAENDVVLISAGNNPHSDLHKITSEQYYIDVTDEALMKEFLVEKKIDGVFSCSSEDVIPHSINYLHALGMNCYATSEQWNMLMNKRNMIDNSTKYGIDQIPEYTVEQKEIIEYPVIIKPAVNCGSIGISVCHCEAELDAAVKKAYKNAKSGEILIERYITEPFWQMEVYIQNGIPYVGFTKERVFYPSVNGQAEQPFLDIYPSRYDERLRQEFFPKFAKMLVDLQIKNASVWVQGFITRSHIYTFDVGFRMGGAMDYRAVEKEKGVNNVLNHLEYAITGEWTGDFSKCRLPFSTQYVTICIGLKNGTIQSIKGIEEIKKNQYVYDVVQYYAEGDTVTTSGLYTQSLIRVFIKDAQHVLKEVVYDIFRKVEVKDISGENMLLPINGVIWNNDFPLGD